MKRWLTPLGPALSALALVLVGAISMNQATWAQERAAGDPPVTSDKTQQRQRLAEQLKVTMEQVKNIQEALKELDGGVVAEPEMASVAAAPVSKEDATVLAPVEVLGARIERNPEGRAIGKVEREDIENSRAFSLKELVEAAPGLTARQGNGPRDVNISIRGAGAKQNFGVRNIKTYEDWFPTTQSDGLSRTDVNDPHAYEGVDIIRGPSSSLYDKEAMGGVINFRTRRGRDIQGFEVGNDAGSRGYHNHWLHVGDQLKSFEYSLFGSYIRGDGFMDHSQFNTATQNLLVTFTPDAKRSFTFKVLNNDLDTKVPSRLTLAEARANPKDAGTTFVTGVGTVTAERAAQARRDRRTIVGGRYEQQLDANTGLRVLGAYDVKDINQTFGSIFDGSNPNFHTYADITREGTVGGLNAKHYAGFFFNYMEQEASSFRNLADGFGTRGALQSNTRGFHRNIGGRLREEIQFDPKWTGVAGIGVESSDVSAQAQNRTAAEAFSLVSVNRNFFNVAPELAVMYKHSPDLSAHGRVATGYGIPSIGNLTTTSAGLPGNNLDLKPQRNVGFELGVDGRPVKALAVSLAGYYEFWFNEFISQSPGAGLTNFTSNAPTATHRGVEAALDWRPIEGWRLTGAYTFNDHRYLTFNERISGVSFDRDGKQIPGVERHFANARVRYESPYHLGAWLEVNWMDGYFANNSNTLKTEAYNIYNLNVHYNRDLTGPIVKGVLAYFEVQNLFDNTYIASAQVVADATTDTPFNLATTKQSFFAGDARSYFAGVKLKF